MYPDIFRQNALMISTSIAARRINTGSIATQMTPKSIRSHLAPYSIFSKRKTTVAHAFASALAPLDEYDEDKLKVALDALGQKNFDPLSCVDLTLAKPIQPSNLCSEGQKVLTKFLSLQAQILDLVAEADKLAQVLQSQKNG